MKRHLHKILLLLWLGALLGCAQQSSTTEEDPSVSGKPGDETEEIPGYLVGPEGIQVTPINGQATRVLISAGTGVVTGNEGSYEGVYITIWGIEAGKDSTSATFSVRLLNAVRVNADGSFSMEVEAAGYGELILQASSQNPGLFSLNLIEGGPSNSALLKPFESGFTPTYFQNEVSDIFMARPSGVDPEKANRLSLFYSNLSDAVETKTISVRMEIFNIYTETLDLQNYEILYFMTDDGLTTQFGLTSEATFTGGSVLYAYNDLGADSYISFLVNESYELAPGQSAVLSFRITNTEDSNFDQSDDPSFIEAQTESAISERIHIFDDVNDKLWGN